tara:strand:- start:705 stop:863 length:159 start_codon:yes stop_codon:yes gene_type:complete
MEREDLIKEILSDIEELYDVSASSDEWDSYGLALKLHEKYEGELYQPLAERS